MMDEKEKEEILYRLDERTKRVDESLDRLNGKVEKNRVKINTIETISDQNQRDISYGKAIIGFLSATVSAVAAKVVGLIHI